jgi:hypothetical protein
MILNSVPLHTKTKKTNCHEEIVSRAQGDADHHQLVTIRMESYRGEAKPYFPLSS